MYNPIQLNPNMIRQKQLMESFSINSIEESLDFKDIEDQVYCEAVFAGGKEKLKRAEEILSSIKNELLLEIKNDKKKGSDHKAFKPKEFWSNKLWKDFENELIKVFNFRSVSVNPYIERYTKSTDDFESKSLNAFTYSINRYAIDALISNNGLYDKTRSVILEIYMSLGLIRAFNTDQIMAILLHEIGHNIDPALVSIAYTGTNVLCKYMTDRNPNLKPCEKHSLEMVNKDNDSKNTVVNKFTTFVKSLKFVAHAHKMKSNIFDKIFSPFKKIFEKYKTKQKDKRTAEMIDSITNVIDNDRTQFNYQEYTEAFADNFARMYGYGPALSSAFKIMDDDYFKYLNEKSELAKELKRQQYIANMTIDCINDEHKTDIHRIKNLIREYEKDLNDPNIPNKVKEAIKEDKKSCEDVLDQYLHHKDEFQARINNIINDALDELDKTYKEKHYNQAEEKDNKKTKAKSNDNTNDDEDEDDE